MKISRKPKAKPAEPAPVATNPPLHRTLAAEEWGWVAAMADSRPGLVSARAEQ